MIAFEVRRDNDSYGFVMAEEVAQVYAKLGVTGPEVDVGDDGEHCEIQAQYGDEVIELIPYWRDSRSKPSGRFCFMFDVGHGANSRMKYIMANSVDELLQIMNAKIVEDYGGMGLKEDWPYDSCDVQDATGERVFVFYFGERLKSL